MEDPNRSIECTVDKCRYHCGGCDYCSLSSVLIASHEEKPYCSECVDCCSFEPKE